MTFATTPTEYKELRVGNPSVNGWMIDTKTIIVEGVDAKGRADGRNFDVFFKGKFVGTVYYMSGGQYSAINLAHEQVSTHTGHDAHLKCFVDLVLLAVDEVCP